MTKEDLQHKVDKIFTLVKTRVEERISVLEDELMEMLQEARKQFN